jgi:hypothetical protein
MTPWTSREDWLALKFPAEQVAKITGRSLVEVVERQDLLRKAPAKSAWRWSQEEQQIALSLPPTEAAQLIGRTRRAIYHRRRRAAPKVI